MTAGAHDAVTLGCYALGVLDAHESHGVEQHLRDCPACRAQVADFHLIRMVLDELPRETFLPEQDIPTKPSDLVLQRALRQIRHESTIPEPRAEQRPRVVGSRASPVPAEELPEPQHAKPRRWPGYLAAAAVAAVVAFGGAAVFTQNQSPSSTSASSVFNAEGSSGGIRLVAEVAASSQDRYLVTAKINGLPAAQKCKLIVIKTDGTKAEAHAWTSKDKVEANVSGMVSVSPDQVKSVAVENAEGKQFVVASR